MRELNAIEANDVVVQYGDVVALAPSSFVIPAGSITAVIGPNGSGKSTLLSLVAGLVKPARGSIEVRGGLDQEPSISFVLQTTKVNDALPISVGEVVAMGRYSHKGPLERLTHADRAAIDESMERLAITDISKRHLNHLSGGQRQRAFVAQGLAQDHDILLLDEPLSGIDMTTAQAIDGVIHDEINKGCTVVLTTHDLSEARIADHVLLLSGRVVASGPPDEVLTLENLSEAYGTTLLHLDGEKLFIDDAAHRPSEPRHVHGERQIHTEGSRTRLHGDGSDF